MKKLLLTLTLTASFLGGSAVHAETDSDYQVIAHRGASWIAPEHTLAAYDIAKEQGADYIELDLRTTKDGQLVAMHDAKVDRTTNGKGYVNKLTLAQIKRFDAGSFFNKKHPSRAQSYYKGLKVPTMEEVFKRYGTRAKFYIELRNEPKVVERSLALIKKYKMENNVIIQSFQAKKLREFHKLNAKIPLVQLVWAKSKFTNAELAAYTQYAFAVGMNADDISAKNSSMIHAAGLRIHTYFSTKEWDSRYMVSTWYADGGITDKPTSLEKWRYKMEAMK